MTEAPPPLLLAASGSSVREAVSVCVIVTCVASGSVVREAARLGHGDGHRPARACEVAHLALKLVLRCREGRDPRAGVE